MNLKKLILLLICFVLVLSYFPTAYATENDVLPTIYGYDNFEMYEVGAKDFKFAVAGEKVASNKIEIAESNGNKYMYYFRKLRDPLVDFVVNVTEDSFVYEADYAFETGKGTASLFSIINYNKASGKDEGTSLIKYYGSSKSLVAFNGSEEVTVLEDIEMPDTFYKISLVIDQVNDTYDVYINRSLVKEKLKFNYDYDFTTMKKFRMTADGSVSGNAIFKLDNWIVYGGEAFIDGEKQIRDTIFYTTDEAINYFKACTAFSEIGKSALLNGEKITIDTPSVIHNGEVYISEELADTEYEITSVSQNGQKYLKLSELCEKQNLNYYRDKTGFTLIGEREFPEPDFTPGKIGEFNEYTRYYLELYNYLTFKRPTAGEIKAKYLNLSHPRLICTEANFTKIKNEISSGGIKKQFYDKLISEADGYLTLEAPTYAKPDGVRLNVHNYAQPIRHLALAYQLSGNGEYAKKAAELMVAICSYADWNPTHFLDIGVIMGSIAIGYDWIYDQLSSKDAEIIENGMYNNGIIPSYEAYLGGANHGWTITVGNWNAVCNSGVVLGALALYDKIGDECFDFLSFALRSLEYQMLSFAPDGGYEEGLSYLSYATRHLSYIIGAFDSALGTDFNYYNAPGFSNSPYYSFCVTGAKGGFNFHDASGGNYSSAEASWHAAKQGNGELHALRYNQIKSSASNNWFDLIYLDEAKINSATDLPLDTYFANVETGSMRSHYDDSSASYIGYHCGKNTAGHMNYDSGTFVFDQMGVRWAIDLGTDDYNLVGYNETDNNPIYRKRAEGQNVYVINPDKTAGQLTKTNDYVEKRSSDENSSFVIMNLSDAYGRDASSARRGIMLGENRNTLIVRDEIEFINESEFYWFMHTKSEITVDGNTAYLTQNGKKMKLEFISNQPLVLRESAAIQQDLTLRDEGENPNTGITKITIGGTVSGKLNLTVKLTPVIDGGVFASVSNVPLDEWKNGDCEEYSSEITLYSIDENGSLLECEVLGGNMQFDLKAANISSKNGKIQVVAALYSQDKLMDVLWTDYISVDRLSSVQKQLKYNLTNVIKPEIKLFVFEDLNSLNPKASLTTKR